MTIHREHPFLPPEGERDPVRRLRGRLPAPVTVWATGRRSAQRPTGATSIAGLTVSSMLIAEGDPALVVALIDEDSDLWPLLAERRTTAISILTTGHGQLAEAFAGTAPAPGGPFTLGDWTDTDWGPVLADNAGWLGARLVEGAPRHLGWALLVEAVIEHTEIGDEPALSHIRGRFR